MCFLLYNIVIFLVVFDFFSMLLGFAILPFGGGKTLECFERVKLDLNGFPLVNFVWTFCHRCGIGVCAF